MKRLNIIITSLTLVVGLALPGLVSAQAMYTPARYMAVSGQADACNGLSQLGGTPCSSDPTKNSPGQNEIAKIAKTIVNIISFLVGIAAVIMIVISGVRFVTSGGESSAVSSAKNTLVYAIIGLVIVALAQVIVHFVLNAILTGSTNTGVT